MVDVAIVPHLFSALILQHRCMRLVLQQTRCSMWLTKMPARGHIAIVKTCTINCTRPACSVSTFAGTLFTLLLCCCLLLLNIPRLRCNQLWLVFADSRL
jgi:hypothetical protein